MRTRRLIPAIVAAAAMVAAGCSSTDSAGQDDVVTVTRTTSAPSGGESGGNTGGDSGGGSPNVTVPSDGGSDTGEAGTSGAAPSEGSGQPTGDSPAEPSDSAGASGTAGASDTAGASGSSGAPSSSKSSKKTTTKATKPSKPADGRPESNVPMTKLKKGEKPPQFIIFSFDGAGSHEKWGQFMEAAKPTDSRFVGFLTGIYLVETANKDAYTGPGHSPGKASVGFGGEKHEIVTEIEDLNKAFDAGHEIGTHYNGHFCAGAEPSGKDWNTADWNSELDQFMKFLTDYKKINGWGDEVPNLKVTPDDIKGGRTPCLEGVLNEMVPAWKKHGLTYDTSLSTKSGISWPVQMQGIWEFEMPYIYSPGFDGMVMAMDYNFACKVADCNTEPDISAETRPKVRATYDYMYEQAFKGSRAPVLIANHFNDWNGNSYNQPALEFMKDTCGKKDTYCATYQDVIQWMELQDPEVLADLQNQPAVAAGPNG